MDYNRVSKQRLCFIDEDNTDFFPLMIFKSVKLLMMKKLRPGLTSFGKLSSTNIHVDLSFDITNSFSGFKHLSFMSFYVLDYFYKGNHNEITSGTALQSQSNQSELQPPFQNCSFINHKTAGATVSSVGGRWMKKETNMCCLKDDF